MVLGTQKLKTRLLRTLSSQVLPLSLELVRWKGDLWWWPEERWSVMVARGKVICDGGQKKGDLWWWPEERWSVMVARRKVIWDGGQRKGDLWWWPEERWFVMVARGKVICDGGQGFEPSKPLRVTSELNMNFYLSLSYSAHKSFNINHNILQHNYFKHKHTQIT